MDNLLSGAIGGLIATIISGIVGFYIFKKQSTIESNRIFIHDLLQTLQKIYLSVFYNNSIDTDNIKYIISFQVINFKEFTKLNKLLKELSATALTYNEGVTKSLQSPTTTSTLQAINKPEMERKINEIVLEIRRLT